MKTTVARLGIRKKSNEHDLVFVISKRNRGWILEAICYEIAKFYPAETSFHYRLRGLPRARAYFFSHYSLFPHYLRRYPWLEDRVCLVFYTHPRDIGLDSPELVKVLSRSSRVVSMSSLHAEGLISSGMDPASIEVVLPGADPNLFKSHERSDGLVGFCGAYYERKAPEVMARIVQEMPNRRFLLLGRGWDEWSGFAKMKSLPNFIYLESPYSDYPHHYSSLDVFVSPSQLEGGPIALLETMMSNVVPVASRTGFAPDLIRHGENGFLFDLDSDVDTITHLIEKAFDINTDVRSTVEHLTWERFAKQIGSLIKRSD